MTGAMYSIQLFHHRTRKQYSGLILDQDGRAVYHLVGTGREVTDAQGTVVGQFKPHSHLSTSIGVLDPLGAELGSIACTRGRVKKGWVTNGQPAQYTLFDSLGRPFGIAEPYDHERLEPSYIIRALDGGPYAIVSKGDLEDFYRVEVVGNEGHPLIVLAYVVEYGHPLSFAAN